MRRPFTDTKNNSIVFDFSRVSTLGFILDRAFYCVYPMTEF